MGMWFFDETNEMEEYQAVRKEVRRLEWEYHELRVVLHAAEVALRDDPEDENLQAKVRYYRKRLKDLEAKHPWFIADCPIEVSLFLPPHG
jgi:hypothetical protein